MTKAEISYPSLDTPSVLVDMEKLEGNIKEMSRLAAGAGVRLRPHTKIHESALIARIQTGEGACGVEVGPVDQAEVMAEAGFTDIVVAHPFYGSHKLETLKKVLGRPGVTVTVVVDMFEQAESISQLGQATGIKIPVLLKLETGANRYGVLPGEPALQLARQLCRLPGIEFEGVYTHETGREPTTEGIEREAFEIATIAVETARMLKKEKIPVAHVSVGASATYRASCRLIKEGKFPEITEIHPGSGIVGDLKGVSVLALPEDSCTLSVLVSVMSASHPSHAVIDAGFKTFGADSLINLRDTPGFFWEGKPRLGAVRGRPDLWLGALHAETGRIFYRNRTKKLHPGDRLEIIPNNATLVINLHDRLYGVRNGAVEQVIPVTGRGRGS